MQRQAGFGVRTIRFCSDLRLRCLRFLGVGQASPASASKLAADPVPLAGRAKRPVLTRATSVIGEWRLGRVLLTWSPRDSKLLNQWAMNHTTTLAGGQPILALDMYEHSYHMDYGARAAAYVDAYMAAINGRMSAARMASSGRDQLGTGDFCFRPPRSSH